mmetsp:Transcript_86916/g.245147  ORF Transcript_86916/g.245147 Transcript_86916/m.245147 type:complete len:315 (+) Transcript_86916:144-1088(+)
MCKNAVESPREKADSSTTECSKLYARQPSRPHAEAPHSQRPTGAARPPAGEEVPSTATTRAGAAPEGMGRPATRSLAETDATAAAAMAAAAALAAAAPTLPPPLRAGAVSPVAPVASVPLALSRAEARPLGLLFAAAFVAAAGDAAEQRSNLTVTTSEPTLASKVISLRSTADVSPTGSAGKAAVPPRLRISKAMDEKASNLRPHPEDSRECHRHKGQGSLPAAAPPFARRPAVPPPAAPRATAFGVLVLQLLPPPTLLPRSLAAGGMCSSRTPNELHHFSILFSESPPRRDGCNTTTSKCFEKSSSPWICTSL